MIIYNYLISNHGNIDVWWELDFAGTMQCALPRALAGISLGYFVRGVYEKLCVVGFLQAPKLKVIASILGWCLVVASIVMAVLAPHTQYDFVHILILSMIIILLAIGIQVPMGGVSKKIEAISMPLYIWQVVAIRLVTLTGEQSFVKLIAVLLLDFAICFLWLRLSKHWKISF